MSAECPFPSQGSGKVCFLCVCVDVCFLCVCMQNSMCTGQIPLLENLPWLLKCWYPWFIIWGLPYVTHIQWQIHAWLTTQFNWGQFRRVSSSLGLSLWGSLSLGCLTAQLSPLFLPFPFLTSRLQEHSSTSFLQAKLHPWRLPPQGANLQCFVLF